MLEGYAWPPQSVQQDEHRRRVFASTPSHQPFSNVVELAIVGLLVVVLILLYPHTCRHNWLFTTEPRHLQASPQQS
jgi:hypothetical protein